VDVKSRNGSGVTVVERRKHILDFLARQNQASITELSQALQRAPSAIRRDLRILESNGLLMRTHGGARASAAIPYTASFRDRVAEQAAAKQAIALAAKAQIAPGSVIGLMGGTTCTELARQLRTADNLMIVTNAVNVAMELQNERVSKRVMLTGGFINRDSYELVGNALAASLRDIHLDLAFVGASGVDLQFGLSMSDEPEAAAARAFASVADRVVVLADHSKIGKLTFARFSLLSEIQLLITDSDAEPEQLASLRQAGLQVLVAGEASDN
jgi:DeoR/GlpR family transcriptional regulator of sugar metabolism